MGHLVFKSGHLKLQGRVLVNTFSKVPEAFDCVPAFACVCVCVCVGVWACVCMSGIGGHPV